MEASEKICLRVFWQKVGNAKYISHLDTQRAVSRALVRSELPLRYTQGFNPHLKLVFALPIAIYQECLYDIFDVKLEQAVAMEAAARALSAAMPRNMPVLRVGTPVRKLKELSLAGYELRLDTEMSAKEVLSAFSGAVVVEKKTKKKTETTDVSAMIKTLSAEEKNGGVMLDAVLSASPEAYLNPRYLTDFLGARVKGAMVTRTALLASDGSLFE